MKRFSFIGIFFLCACLTYAQSDDFYRQWLRLYSVDWLPGDEVCYDYQDLSSATTEGLVYTYGEYVAIGDNAPDFRHPASYTKTFTVDPQHPILSLYVLPQFGPVGGGCGQQDSIRASFLIIIDRDTLQYEMHAVYSFIEPLHYYYDLKGKTEFTITIKATDCAADVHYMCCKMAIGCTSLPPLEITKHYCENADTLVTLSVRSDDYPEDPGLYWANTAAPNTVLGYGHSITVSADKGESYSCFWSVPGVFINALDTVLTATAEDGITDALECPVYERYDTIYITSRTERTTWHGQTILGPGVFATDTLATVYGCDSVCHMAVKIVQNIYELDTVCGPSYVWRGEEYFSEGHYQTEQIYGALEDTIYHLLLKFKDCPPDEHEWQEGHPLNPTVDCVQSFSTLDTTVYCDSLLWFGKWYDASGTYQDTLAGENYMLCDSIGTLHLTVIDATPIVQTADTTVCDTVLPVLWRGVLFVSDSVYRDTLYTAHGCDSVYRTYRLDTITCYPPLPPDPPDPPQPPVEDTCASDMVYEKWTNLIFCDNGRDEFVAYQWYRDNTPIAGEHGQYLYLPDGMGTSEYFVEATDTLGHKQRSCPKRFDETPRSADTYANVQSVVRRGETLHIEMSDPTAEVFLYSAIGQIVMSRAICSIDELPISLPVGIYVLYLKGETISTITKVKVE